MRISSLHLTNFRNHCDSTIGFEPGNNVILGKNGLGKTNVAEAIYYCATLGSHRVSGDAPLIRTGCLEATIQAEVAKHDRRANLEIDIKQAGANAARINGVVATKFRDILGLVKTVIFSPEDLDLVRGEPTYRRSYLDDFCLQMRPAYASIRLDYEKALRQRNSLLKSFGRRSPHGQALSSLEAWDEQLVATGVKVLSARLHALSELAPLISQHGEMISAGSEPLVVTYLAKWSEEAAINGSDLKEQLEVALVAQRTSEIDRGVTLVGPHRDDLGITLNGSPAKGYASHGQSWSIALALKFAVFSMLRQLDDDPILILDDVFAELDAHRRSRLESALTDVEQTIITVADEDDVPTSLHGRFIELSSVMNDVG